MMHKEMLRKQALAARQSAQHINAKEAAIINSILHHIPRGACTALYHPFRGEVSIVHLVDLLPKSALPRINNKQQLTFHKYEPEDTLIPHKYGMLEPEDTSPKAKPKTILVPMVGFDNAKNRLGYGGGYYDKALAAMPKTLKIGVAFACQQLDAIPTNPHDVAMDMIITENGVL